MKERLKSYHLARFLLIIVSFITLLFISWIIYKTTEVVCLLDDSRTILERLKAVPFHPEKSFIVVVILYLLIFGNLLIRELFCDEIDPTIIILLSFFELIITLLILGILDFSFKYILLVPIANGITYLPNKWWKTFYTTVVVLCFVFIDYQIISIWFSVFSVEDFINYHPTITRAYILGLRNILFFISEALFITFIVLELQNVLEESQRIKRLNEELKMNKEKLEFANVQLQNYAERVEEIAKIRERNRLAREIHDTVGHYLTGITLGLTATEELMKQKPNMVLEQLKRLKDLAQQGLVDIRRSLKELRPDMLEKGKLSAAIKKLAYEINSNTTKKIDIDIIGNIDELTPALDETIYRIIQESITNAIRHGDATQIKLNINVDDRNIHLSIIDNGVGTSEIKEGFGLHYMKQRVLDHNGFLEIETQPGKGMGVFVFIPRSGAQYHD
ncbi:sensor histidine kinase [Gracilinema caldarium]|jgi:signal transduction histidine kinase|uniref:sensor histidine kinase n=1 Tax=Gracilinema caldarium TaxID=215591 RepID=UPI0026EDF742|nr:sensor histidine kinase [Gracilinema caldarium]